MALSELLQYLSQDIGWLMVGLVAVPLLLALTVARIVLRRGRPRLAWFGGLAAIGMVWLLLVGWVLLNCFSRDCAGELMALALVNVVVFALAAVIESLVFSSIYVGMRVLHASRAYAAALRPYERVRRNIWVLVVITIGVMTGAALANAFAQARASGEFVSWRNIGSPPGNISALLRADTIVVEVESGTGEKYYANIYLRPCRRSPALSSCWIEGEARLASKDMDSPAECARRFHTEGAPPGAVEVVARARCNNDLTMQTMYTVLPDGELSVWHHRTDGSGLFAQGAAALIIGSVLGFIGGSLVIALATRRAANRFRFGRPFSLDSGPASP